MSALFVTASGTGVGKTLVTAVLAWQLRARGDAVEVFKPVVSGFDARAVEASDTGVLLRALGRAATPAAIEGVSPWRFAAPLSPDMAARREGRGIDFDALVASCRERAQGAGCVLIEGVGGALVPLDERHTVRDWIAALGAPAILVAGSYLGTISHTLTALEALTSRGIAVAGIVLSESPDSPVGLDETAAAIARFAAGTRVLAMPRLAGAEPWRGAPDLLRPLHL
jgi:dethiobiotin synthetase